MIRIDKLTEEEFVEEVGCRAYVIGIDPGPTMSGVVVLQTDMRPIACGHITNDHAERMILCLSPDHVVCEDIVAYGLSVGASTFDTAKQIGRYEVRADLLGACSFALLNRRDIKLLTCGDAKAKDKDILAAMIQTWGEPGTAKKPGPTFGFTSHTWSALAVCTAWLTKRRDENVRKAMELEGAGRET
jgi:hypothetical protein